MPKKNINAILIRGTENELRKCLKEAKRLAKEGLIIELLDHLIPEDTKTVHVQDGKRRRIIRR